MLNILNKLNKDQKGILAIVSGLVVVLLAWNIIPGLTAILAIGGLALIGLGLYILEVHKKVMALFQKK